MKGGHNEECHNHNDVGEMVVYADGEPLLIDPGVGEYTSKTFSNDRYSIWTMQSGYHNLPQINGCDQKNGKEYKARVISRQKEQIVLDIAAAYPQEAAVDSWQRKVSLKKHQIYVTEEYTLTAHKGVTNLIFITPVKPDITKSGVVQLGTYQLKYDARLLTASIEDISQQLDSILKGMWGTKLYRIVLVVKDNSLNNRICYQIR
jgi:hypothetical protein